MLGTAAYSTYLVADKFDFIQSINAARFPWSILLFGVGGLCALVASFMLILIVAKWEQYGLYRSSDDDSLLEEDMPMSDMSKSRKERGVDNMHYTDYPREPPYDAKRGYQDRNGYGGSRKYEYQEYSSRDRGYDRDRYDRDRSYDRYGYEDRSYDRYYSKDRGYGRDYDRGYDMSYDRRGQSYDREYAMSRKENMYRPYAQRY